MKSEHPDIERTLNSFEGFQRPQKGQALYERILQGIGSAETKIIAMSPLQRWSIAAGIALLIVLNIASLRHTNHSKGEKNAFAQEYFSYLHQY